MEERELVEQEVESSPALEGIQELAEHSSNEDSAQQEQVQTPPQKPIENDDNVRRLRKAKEESERREEALLRRLEALERQQKPAEPEEDYNVNINPDEIAEGKHLIKLNRKIQKLEKESVERIQRYEQQMATVAAEAQLRTNYPDIDKVINTDNLERLKEDEPELYATVMANNDLYSKSVAAYKMIKRMNIQQDSSVVDSQVRLQQNNLKPRNSSSIAPQRGESPLDKVNAYSNGLTKEMKEQARRELAAILGR